MTSSLNIMLGIIFVWTLLPTLLITSFPLILVLVGLARMLYQRIGGFVSEMSGLTRLTQEDFRRRLWGRL